MPPRWACACTSLLDLLSSALADGGNPAEVGADFSRWGFFASGPLGRGDVDPADVWVSFRGVLWIASSAFGLSQIPLIMRNLTSPDAPVDPMAPAEPDTAP